MNIFYLSENIEKCVKYHVDKHIVKMPIETTQLLSASSRLLGVNQGYKLSHAHHPDVKWAMESKENWEWLRNFGLALCKEYTYRYGRIHASQSIIDSMINPVKESKGFTPPPQCMPEIYKNENCVWAYRNYYCGDKRRLFTWKGRPKPLWIDFDVSIDNYIEIEAGDRIFKVSSDYVKIQSLKPYFIYIRIYYEKEYLCVLSYNDEAVIRFENFDISSLTKIVNEDEKECIYNLIQTIMSLRI